MPESTDTAVTGRTSKAILLIPILVGWVFLSEGIQSSVDCGGWTNQGRKGNRRPPRAGERGAGSTEELGVCAREQRDDGDARV